MSAVKTGIRKNFFNICLLAFAGSIIYGLPYFRSYYYDAYCEAYNLTNTQMGTLGSAYGLLGLVSYFIGGVLADKLSAKKLLIFSLIATGLGGFTHLLTDSYYILLAIYGLWGITSLLTFWPALMKIIRTQGNEDEQSRAYGLFEGGRGIVGAAHLAVATAIFGAFQAKAAPVMGLKWIIVFYSVCPIICGVLFIFLIKDPQKTDAQEQKQRLTMKQFGRIIRLPAVWLAVLITFTTYVFNMSYFYFTPFATNVIGIAAVLAAVLTVAAQYLRPVASTGGGFLGDKFGKSRLMMIGFILEGAGTAVLIATGTMSGQIQGILVVAACLTVYLGMYSNYGIYFSLLSEGGVPLDLSGVAIGLVATFGYLPEVLCPLIAGRTLDAYSGSTGYNIYFTGMIVCAVVGLIVSIIWWQIYGSKKIKKEEA